MASERDSGTSVRESRAADLGAIVSKALELRDAGNPNWLHDACKQNPALESEVRVLVDRATALPGMIGGTAGLDRLVGRSLGNRFHLLERIGAGAMGVVYMAEDLELRRKVACKVVRHGLMAPERALERFEREARAMAAVQHPAIVTIHDRGRTDDDQVYIVMELVDGTPLSTLLDAATQRAEGSRSDDGSWLTERFGIDRRGEVSFLRTAVRWAADLSLGLEAVHQAGVLHRDIKPSNILVRRDGGPALLDFGIALLDDSSVITRGATSLGTPAYMPPEALQRDVKRTTASDVYSLAATLYHMVTLHAPYEGSPTQVLTALATREPVPAAERRPGLPRDLQAILDKGMCRNPAARYATAAEFEADLRAFLEFRPISARPVTQIERIARRLVRSRAAWGAAAAFVLVAVFFGVRAWRDHQVETLNARHAEIFRHIPPNFTTVNPPNRKFPSRADHVALAQMLDDAVAVAVEPLPTLLLRAAFRQDNDETQGAAADMKVVGDFVATPFAHALAERYATAQPSTAVNRAPKLDGLPPAETTLDRYLLAFQLMRLLNSAQAMEILADPKVREIPHAEEMFLAETNFEPFKRPERKRLALERYAELVRLEERTGGRTATTAHIAGRLLAVQCRFDDALRVCREGIELAPHAYVLRINAGGSAFASNQLAEARTHLELARELRPTYAHIVQNLVWVEIAERRFEAAERLVREAVPNFQPPNPTFGDPWCATIATYAALDARAKGDADLCQREVEKALSLYERLPKPKVKPKDKSIDIGFSIASALAAKDDTTLVVALSEFVIDQPDHWWRLDLLKTHLPRDLDAESTEAVRHALESLGTRENASAPK